MSKCSNCSKNSYLWCLPALKYYLYSNCESTLVNCYFKDNCMRAHSPKEIKLYGKNKAVLEMDMGKINLINVENLLKKSLIENFTFLKKVEYKSNKLCSGKVPTLQEIKQFNFLNLLTYWVQTARHFRKLNKNYGKKYPNMKINLSQKNEDILWAIYRLTHKCEVHMKCIEKIRNKIKKLNRDEFCVGGPNCKEGCHTDEELLCVDDFMTGKCSCLSLKEYTNLREEKKKLFIQLVNQKKEYLKSIRTKKISQKIHTLTEQIQKCKKEYHNIKRKVHFTDRQLVPYQNQKTVYEKQKQKRVESWEHKKTEKSSKVENKETKKKKYKIVRTRTGIKKILL